MWIRQLGVDGRLLALAGGCGRRWEAVGVNGVRPGVHGGPQGSTGIYGDLREFVGAGRGLAEPVGVSVGRQVAGWRRRETVGVWGSAGVCGDSRVVWGIQREFNGVCESL